MIRPLTAQENLRPKALPAPRPAFQRLPRSVKASPKIAEAFRPPSPLNFRHDHDLDPWKKDTIRCLPLVKKERPKIEKTWMKPTINLHSAKLAKAETAIPKNFFQKCTSAKATQVKSQMTQIRTPARDGQESLAHRPEDIRAGVQDFGKGIFESKKTKNDEEVPWFKTRAVQEIQDRLKGKDDGLWKMTSQSEIWSVPKRKRRAKAAGLDDVNIELCQCFEKYEEIELEGQFRTSLIRLFQECIEKKKIPEEWECSHSFTRSKSGPTDLPKNYGPIRLQNTLCKIFS